MTSRVVLPSHYRMSMMEWHEDHWRLWLHHDPQYKFGTYLKLYHNGMIERVTERPDEPCQIFLVKEKNK